MTMIFLNTISPFYFRSPIPLCRSHITDYKSQFTAHTAHKGYRSYSIGHKVTKCKPVYINLSIVAQFPFRDGQQYNDCCSSSPKQQKRPIPTTRDAAVDNRPRHATASCWFMKPFMSKCESDIKSDITGKSRFQIPSNFWLNLDEFWINRPRDRSVRPVYSEFSQVYSKRKLAIDYPANWYRRGPYQFCARSPKRGFKTVLRGFKTVSIILRSL